MLEKDGIEADDIIATLATQAKAGGMKVFIATSDKDFMQIVDDSISLLNPAAKANTAMAMEAAMGACAGVTVRR